MNTNLDKIALDLYGKIQTRFHDIKIGDENADVLSKKADIPKARFFEFKYEEKGRSLGTVAITLDEDDGIVIQLSGELADSKHNGAFRFIRGFRQFAKDRLLKFDVQNIGKDNLDKRDYHFQAKPKEHEPMEPIMENKLYGTARMSYQDLGEAKIIIKHSQPINLDLAAGRTMHIEGIWVENADGERFKYPVKHLNGARALAEHLKHGGYPWDMIGKHITGLSEELAQLRKFKGYVSRNESLSEAMGDITSKVMERIEQVKKEIAGLQRPAYYQAFAESFEDREEQMIPEDIMSDWIDRLTIRTFNEDLKTAFPYIFRLVDESEIPVKELQPGDLLDEIFDGDKETGTTHKGGKVEKTKHGVKHTKTDYEDGNGEKGRKPSEEGPKSRYHKTPILDPEDQFENFIDTIVSEDEDQGEDTLFSPNKDTQSQAIEKLNKILSTELKGGPEGVNSIESLKGIIDDPEFLDSLKDLDPDLDSRPLIQQFIQHNAPELLSQIHFGKDEMGGADAEPAPPAAPPAPAPEAAPAAPPAPDAAAAGAPPQPPAGEDLPPPAPVSESMEDHKLAKLKAKFIQAKECGATLETMMDFGHKEMTLHDAMRECGIAPMECGFEDESGEGGAQQMLKTIAGFWNKEAKNFTIGGTRAKTKVVKGWKEGEFPNASEEDLKKVLHLIDKMDPSAQSNDELGHIKHLAGMGHEHTVDEGPEEDFSSMMQQFQQDHDGIDPNAMLDKWQQEHPDAKVTRTNTSSGTINGKPASYDDAMNQFKGMTGKMGFDTSGDDPIGGMMKGIQGKVGGMMNKAQGQMPNQNVKMPGVQMNPQDMMKGIMSKMPQGMNMPGMNEDAELTAMLKIAGLR